MDPLIVTQRSSDPLTTKCAKGFSALPPRPIGRLPPRGDAWGNSEQKSYFYGRSSFRRSSSIGDISGDTVGLVMGAQLGRRALSDADLWGCRTFRGHDFYGVSDLFSRRLRPLGAQPLLSHFRLSRPKTGSARPSRL
jgi:hypothetical protein